MAFADTASRKFLHGAGGAIAQGVAADGIVGMSFGLDGLWQLVAGLFGSAARLLLLLFEALWHLLQTAAAGMGHLLVLPFVALWHLIDGFFAGLLAAVGSAAHALAAPFEALWQWLQTAAASITSGFDGLWQLIHGFFAGLLAALGSAAHGLAEPFEVLWQWLQTAAAVALPTLLLIAAVACLVALVWFCWPILYAAAMGVVCCSASCLHGVAMVVGRALVGLVCCSASYLYAAAMTAVCCLQPAVMGVARALVQLVCWSAHCLHGVAMVVGRALASLFPVCGYCFRCCVNITMRAPGAAGMVISRAAFVADPRLYFQILRSAGTVVASVVFSTPAVASAVAAPVATLFRS